MNSILALFPIALLSLFASLNARATTYYVATTGNDTNSGTLASPLRTIARGIVVAATNNDTILLAHGTHNEHGLNFGSKNLVLQSQSANPAACVMDCQQLANG